MKLRIPFFILSFFLSLTCLHAKERLVTLGGPTTQIIFALGLGSNIVAVDQSSTQPVEATKLPQVGYIRSVSAEGVLAMRPTRVIATSDIGPSEAVQQLTNSGVPVTIIATPNDPKQIEQTILEIGRELKSEEKARALADSMWEKLRAAQAEASKLKSKPKVLFLMGAGGSFTAAGLHTKAHTLIELSGGSNPFSSAPGYKPISPEAALALKPDLILVAAPGANADTAAEQLRRASGWSEIEAVKKGRVYSSDVGWLLNFGSDIGQAVDWMVSLFKKQNK